jgi:transposase
MTARAVQEEEILVQREQLHAQDEIERLPLLIAKLRRMQFGRRSLPSHLPRQVRKILPKEAACPACGGELKVLGEDVPEMLECVPAHFQVIRQVRLKLAHSNCIASWWTVSQFTFPAT